MELRHFRLLVALAEEGSFTRASARLHLAQPHLSRQVASLEKSLGTRLFARSSRGVRLTPAGRTLLACARDIIERAEEAERVAAQVAGGVSGLLRVASVSSGFSYAIPTLLRRLRLTQPDVLLRVSHLEPTRQMDALRREAIDVGLVRDFTHDADFVYSRIMNESIYVMLSSDHELSGAETISIGQLNDEDFVLFPRHVAPFGFDLLVNVCRRANFSPNIVAEAPSDHVKASLVAGGIGISLVAWSARFLTLPGLVFVPLAEDPRIPLFAVWRRGDENPLIRNFVSLCETELS